MSEEWTPKRVSALIALWNEGLSTSEIGNRLGTSPFHLLTGKVREKTLRTFTNETLRDRICE